MKIMRNRILVRSTALGLLLAASSLQAQNTGCQDQGFMGSGNQVVGTLLGAAVGGLLGSQVGGGTGNKIAIGAGVLAGGLLGNNIGKTMSCADQVQHAETAQQAFETQPAGTTTSWQNPDTDTAGTITPTATYQRSDGTNCRDFEQTVTIDGRYETATGTACRQQDGTWKVVNS